MASRAITPVIEKMRATYYLGIFILVCCVLVYIEASPLASADAMEMKRSPRLRRQSGGFNISNIIKVILKAFIDSILQSIPVVG
ncbi:uncharacterized protein NPIL_457131 [Nephila pilipes]|uniref:Uncharacterized protein n=1 Tax=Nephila pilipes TaxID=299642 RepID=A0A8X6PEK0_NEPPI|nr:uncharacterized protein NPIL_457131 [Nephila pilipes]